VQQGSAVPVEDGSPAGQATESELRIISAERLTFFSDAVVAIAITLLALELPVPVATTNGDFWHDAVEHLEDYLGFLVSFVVIGGHWFAHHRLFRHVTSLGGGLASWNMLWLLMIVLTPFATKVLVANGALAARFTFYALVQALASIFLVLAVHEIDRHRLAWEGTPREVFTSAYRRMFTVAGLFLLSIPLVYLVGRWAYLCWAAIPLVARAQRLAGDRWRRVRPGSPRPPS
jgi:uncharacterized membrane protein